MKPARTAALVVHVAGLAFGVYVAGAAVDSFLVNAGTDITAVTLSRVAVAVSLIALTIAYAVLLYRRGFTLMAPLAFALSYLAIGVIVDVATRAMAKNFAPAAPEELTTHYAIAIAEIAVVALLAFLAWRWTKARSTFPVA